MDALYDPESLRDRPDIEFVEERQPIPTAEFDTTEDRIESHAVVGITNTNGEVLLMDDGEHGWTLTAFPVEDGDEWTAVARLGIERVTGREITLEGVERVRRVEFVEDGPGDHRFDMYDVLFGAEPVEGRPVAEEFEGPGQTRWELEWFDTVPDGVGGGLADDIRLFIE